MRHLPAGGRPSSRGRGVAGLPIEVRATGPGGGSPEAPECRAERGPWGGELHGGLKGWGGGMKEGTVGLDSSGWVSMASGSEGGSCWVASCGESLEREVGASASVSGALEALRGGGTGRALQFLYPAQ